MTKKYEKPVAHALNDLTPVFGACASGVSYTAGKCSYGGTANDPGSDCVNGRTAGYNCNDGLTASGNPG